MATYDAELAETIEPVDAYVERLSEVIQLVQVETNVPTVANVSPAAGAIGPNTPILFDVADESPFRRIMVTASFGGNAEVVHAGGTEFEPLYKGQSTKTGISNGFRFSFLRSGGWPASPSIIIYAIDSFGNEL